MRILLSTISVSLLILAGCSNTALTSSNTPSNTQVPSAKPVEINKPSSSQALDSRYLDNGDGTITDKQTQLMWKKCSEGLSGADCSTGQAEELLWSVAMKKYATPTQFAGHADWRMPSIAELRTVILCSDETSLEQALKKSCGRESYPFYTSHPKAFPNSSIGYWSSSVTDFNPAGVWEIDLYVGTDSWQPVNAPGPASKRTQAVRLVRSAK